MIGQYQLSSLSLPTIENDALSIDKTCAQVVVFRSMNFKVQFDFYFQIINPFLKPYTKQKLHFTNDILCFKKNYLC